MTTTDMGREAPGPGRLETLRDVWQLRSDPLAPFVRRARKYGDVAQAHIPGMHVYTVHRAAHVERVFVSQQDNYVKGDEYDLMAASLGDGLLTSRGERWRRQRALIQPMFAKRHLEPLSDHMTAAGTSILARWESSHADGDEIDVSGAMMGLTLDVVGRALFGDDLTGETTRTMDRVMTQALNETISASGSPLLWAAQALPGMTVTRALALRPIGQRRLRARMAELDAIVGTMIASHRAGTGGRDGDLLSLLLEARDESTGEAMTDRQVRDEVVTFLSAGHETTANALSWMWLLLARNPQARDRLHAEVDELLGDRVPTFADADRLVWTRAVVAETLRLYPPVWMVPRRVVADDVIGGVRIPAGVSVAVVIYLTHRDPDVWPDPETFDPSRFLPEQAASRPRHAYVPFAAGRRVCVGNTFAVTEATLLAAMIARRYSLDIDPATEVLVEPLVTLRPRGGLRMRLRRRTGRQASSVSRAAAGPASAEPAFPG